MNKPMIAAYGLQVRREARQVLDIPALEVAEGEILAVVGANGAGKSTLLQSLALLLPCNMDYRFAGQPARLPQDALALRRQMAVVFQEPLLLDATVLDNVTLPLRLRRIPRREASRRALHWLERLGVGNLANRHGGQLSGGEAQRVNLARALAPEPRVLFLDEPFAALDVITRSELLADLRPLLRSSGVTALFVTHDFTEIPPVADRVAVLHQGRLVQMGTPRGVFHHPEHEAVAGLVRHAAGMMQALGEGSGEPGSSEAARALRR